MPKSVSDKLADMLTKHSVDLLRLAEGSRARVLGHIQQMADELEVKISTIDPTSSPSQKIRLNRMARLLEQANTVIKDGHRDGREALAAELKEVADAEFEYVGKSLDSAVGFNITQATLNPSMLKSLATDALVQGAPSSEWWGRQSAKTRNMFADQVRQGVLQGESTKEIVTRIRGKATGQFETYEINGELRKFRTFSGGIMDVTTREAEALVRTSVAQVANDARLATYRAMGDAIEGVQALVTLDNRTSEICMARSGASWDLEGNPLSVGAGPFPGSPPWHWNCRTTLLPLTPTWGSLIKKAGGNSKLAKEIDKIEASTIKRTQASMDGQVAGGITYQDWLKTKSPAARIDILGPSKAQMFDEGKLQLRDLIDQRGRALTVAQLKDRVVRDFSAPVNFEGDVLALGDLKHGMEVTTHLYDGTAVSGKITRLGMPDGTTLKGVFINGKRVPVSKIEKITSNTPIAPVPVPAKLPPTKPVPLSGPLPVGASIELGNLKEGMVVTTHLKDGTTVSGGISRLGYPDGKTLKGVFINGTRIPVSKIEKITAADPGAVTVKVPKSRPRPVDLPPTAVPLAVAEPRPSPTFVSAMPKSVDAAAAARHARRFAAVVQEKIPSVNKALSQGNVALIHAQTEEMFKRGMNPRLVELFDGGVDRLEFFKTNSRSWNGSVYHHAGEGSFEMELSVPGRSYTVADAKRTFAHEFGHVVDYKIGNLSRTTAMQRGILADMVAKNQADLASIRVKREIMEAEFVAEFRKAEAILGKELGSDFKILNSQERILSGSDVYKLSKSEAPPGISSYGMSNKKEWFAEAFADYFGTSMQHDRLKLKFPGTYNFVKSLAELDLK